MDGMESGRVTVEERESARVGETVTESPREGEGRGEGGEERGSEGARDRGSKDVIFGGKIGRKVG